MYYLLWDIREQWVLVLPWMKIPPEINFKVFLKRNSERLNDNAASLTTSEQDWLYMHPYKSETEIRFLTTKE